MNSNQFRPLVAVKSRSKVSCELDHSARGRRSYATTTFEDPACLSITVLSNCRSIFFLEKKFACRSRAKRRVWGMYRGTAAKPWRRRSIYEWRRQIEIPTVPCGGKVSLRSYVPSFSYTFLHHMKIRPIFRYLLHHLSPTGVGFLCFTKVQFSFFLPQFIFHDIVIDK